MEIRYVSYDHIQKYLKDYYLKYNKRATALKVTNYIKTIPLDQAYYCILDELTFSKSWSFLSDEEFISQLYKLPFPCKASANPLFIGTVPVEIPEIVLFRNKYDVLVFKQLYNLDDIIHSHNYFEIFYVYKGNCELKFENELRTLTEGELCIIAPNSQHSIIHDDENSIIITISIRKSTFDSSFFSLLTNKDLLSSFFRTILYNNTATNYLLFSADNSEDIKLIMRNMILEYNKKDIYSNNCCISLVTLLFSLILRNYSDTVQFYNYDLSNDFYLIITYIQSNYRYLTLNSLADNFHYSKAHLSDLIKKYTGLSFMKLVTKLKMSHAVEYLKNTNLSIEKISELIGYNSSDHFSRTFKKHYNCSPQQYRQNYSLEE